MNKVIAGDYEGHLVAEISPGHCAVMQGFSKRIPLDKTTIKSYEVITEDIRKSAASGVVRGAVGGALLGPVGLLAGLSAKNKGTYQIAIEFKDSKRSLIEVDEKIYKSLIKEMF